MSDQKTEAEVKALVTRVLDEVQVSWQSAMTQLIHGGCPPVDAVKLISVASISLAITRLRWAGIETEPIMQEGLEHANLHREKTSN